MKATEQYFSVVLFIMLYKVVLTFESVEEILKCDHSSDGYRAVLSCSTVYNAVLVKVRKGRGVFQKFVKDISNLLEEIASFCKVD